MAADLIHRNCPVCGCRDAHDWMQKGELRLVRCAFCSMVYADPVSREYATGAYYDAEGSEYYLSQDKLEGDYSAVRFERELRIFHRHCSGEKVLDVGCSTGAFLYQLTQRFPGWYTVLGTDASGPALDYAASRGVPVWRGSFLEMRAMPNSFDAVTFWAVLEHVLEPRQFLNKAASLLQAGGLCFVLVPNVQSLASRILGARYRYVYPQHLNYFTRATLLKLAAPAFHVVEARSTHFNPLVIWQDLRRRAEVSNPERAALLQRTNALKQSRWLLPVKLMYKLGEWVLGSVNLADNLLCVFQKSSK